MLSCVWVIDGFWIDDWIYWTLLHATHDYILQLAITHRLVFSVTLLCSSFQQWMFVCFLAHVLTGWQPSHANLMLWLLASASTLPASSQAGLTSNFSCQFPTGFRGELAGFQSQSFVTTDSQSASLSWYQAPIWGLRPDFYYVRQLRVCLCGGALSDERTGQSFTIGADPLQHSHSRVLSLMKLATMCYSLRFETSFLSPPMTRRLRWRYSTPPTHGKLCWLLESQSKLHCDWWSVNQ
jgi:hypothetical protein